MKFEEFSISSSILRALKEAGYREAFPIQEAAIQPALEGRDLVGCAQTGTGKTAAFAIPVLQRLSKQVRRRTDKKQLRALVLTPTRELAFQIFESFRRYSKYTYIRNCVVFGGVRQLPQQKALERGADVLIATPGRLLDLMQQGYIDLSHIQILVLDEADRMLDMGFLPDVKKVLKQLPDRRQTLLFSATMPKEISKLIQTILVNPLTVKVAPVSSTVDAISQRVYFVEKKNKTKLLISILKKSPSVTSAIVFMRTKRGTDQLAKELRQAGIAAQSIHGDKTQWERQQTLKDFKNHQIQILVATDIAARGINVDRLSHVFNYDLPDVAETYVHRIGRTGRAGEEGVAIALCSPEEKPLLDGVEKLIRKKIKVLNDQRYSLSTSDSRLTATEKKKSSGRASKRSASPRNQRRTEPLERQMPRKNRLQPRPPVQSTNEVLDFARRQPVSSGRKRRSKNKS